MEICRFAGLKAHIKKNTKSPQPHFSLGLNSTHGIRGSLQTDQVHFGIRTSNTPERIMTARLLGIEQRLDDKTFQPVEGEIPGFSPSSTQRLFETNDGRKFIVETIDSSTGNRFSLQSFPNFPQSETFYSYVKRNGTVSIEGYDLREGKAFRLRPSNYPNDKDPLRQVAERVGVKLRNTPEQPTTNTQQLDPDTDF